MPPSLPPNLRRHDPVLFAWIGGLVLAALIYLVGPDQFLFRVQDTLHMLAWRVSEGLSQLSIAATDLVRALALGLYATFLVLAVAVARRGGRARMMAVVLSLVFLLLVNGADMGASVRWTAALVVSGLGAAVMTGRLRETRALARV